MLTVWLVLIVVLVPCVPFVCVPVGALAPAPCALCVLHLHNNISLPKIPQISWLPILVGLCYLAIIGVRCCIASCLYMWAWWACLPHSLVPERYSSMENGKQLLCRWLDLAALSSSRTTLRQHLKFQPSCLRIQIYLRRWAFVRLLLRICPCTFSLFLPGATVKPRSVLVLMPIRFTGHLIIMK